MSQGPRDFKRLKIWQLAHEVVILVYKACKKFPRQEMFGLASQMQRAAVSVPSNIAEGCGRGGAVELKRYLVMARGSVSELAYQVYLANDLDYVSDDVQREIDQKLDSLSRMIAAYAASIGKGS